MRDGGAAAKPKDCDIFWTPAKLKLADSCQTKVSLHSFYVQYCVIILSIHPVCDDRKNEIMTDKERQVTVHK